MKKKIMLGILALSTIALLSVSFVAAFHPPFAGKLSEADKQKMHEFRNSLQQAVQNNDYNSWKSLMEAQLTEDNFNKLVDNYNARTEFKQTLDDAKKSGDYSKVDQLKQQHGFKGSHYWMRDKHMNYQGSSQ